MKQPHTSSLTVTLTRRQAWPIQAMLAATGEDPGLWVTRTLLACALAHIHVQQQRLHYLFGVQLDPCRKRRRMPCMVPVPIWPADMASTIAMPGELVALEPLASGGRRLLVPLALARLVSEAAGMIEARSADWVRMVLVAAAEPYWLPRIV